MAIRSTRTYAVLEISEAAFNEIRDKLKEAGYEHTFMPNGRGPDGIEIDMHGIAVAPIPPPNWKDTDVTIKKGT